MLSIAAVFAPLLPDVDYGAIKRVTKPMLNFNSF